MITREREIQTELKQGKVFTAHYVMSNTVHEIIYIYKIFCPNEGNVNNSM